MKSLRFRILIHFSVALSLIWILFPFYWLVAVGFMNLSQLSQRPPVFFPTPSLKSYVDVVTGHHIDPGSIVRPLINSTIVGLSVAGLTVLFACTAGFAFSRFNFRLKRLSFSLLLVVRIMPGMLIVIPYFTIFRTFHLLNTLFVLILVYLTLTVPFAIWIFTGYMNAVPKDLEETAMVDGLSHFQAFFRIVMRAALPGVLTIALFSFLTSWGEYLFAITLTNNLTFPPVLFEINDHSDMAAAAALSLLPPVVLTAIFQKHLVKGLSGALKT